MTVELDNVVFAGRAAIAALVTCSVERGSERGVWFTASKRPVALLARHDDRTLAFEADGTRIALDDLERRHPGMRAKFESRANALLAP